MAERSAAIPAPEPDDPDDVAVALETAGALWGIGEKAEAVRRVRRAAEGAEQAGNDLRAVKLARTAADLASEIQTQAATAGSTPTPPPASTSRPATPAPPPVSARGIAPFSDEDTPPRPSVRPHPPPPSRSSTSPSAPAPAASAPQASRSSVVPSQSRSSVVPSQSRSSVVPSRSSSRPPPSSGAAQTIRPSATPSRRPPPPSARQRPSSAAQEPSATPSPPSARGPSTPPPLPQEAATPAPPSSRSRAMPPPLPEEPPPPSTRLSPVTSPEARAQNAHESASVAARAAAPELWHALRVSVEPSVRDPNLFIVRRLEANKPAPHGTREAMIVVVDSSAELLGAQPTRGPGSSARH